jgi:hypothetical protein
MAAQTEESVMAAQALAVETGQIELYEDSSLSRPLGARPTARLCAGCRAKEARYGFEREVGVDALAGVGASRPNTLCFECFRMEIDRRQRVAAQLARGWNAEQVKLPLAETLKELDLRRRKAQIAARHALGA